jgi:molecular chaperone DnaJ
LTDVLKQSIIFTVRKMAGKDYYGILGVNRNASERELKQAYRRLARKYHPDVNAGDRSAEARFKEINEAYEVLANKENRQKYDQFGDQWQYADQFARAGYQQSPFQDFTRGGTGFRFEEADLGSLFDGLFGGRFRTQRARPRRGRDIEHPVEVTLEEAYYGTKRTIALESREPCSTCQGTGYIQNVPCSVCRGAGVMSRIKRLEVKIPPGVRDRSRVRIAGKGEPGPGGTNGDLYLTTSVKPHQLFERKGDDLYVVATVPLTVAMLGGEIQVPNIDGKLALKIPPETQNGKVFRLPGKGMTHLGNSSRGDLMVKTNIALPEKLSAEEKKLFERLRQLRPDS